MHPLKKFTNYRNITLKCNYFFSEQLLQCKVGTLYSLSCCDESIIKVLLHAKREKKTVVKYKEMINVAKFKF